MSLSQDQSDSVSKLICLGVTLDQALLALINESWNLGKAADACFDTVYTVTAKTVPTVVGRVSFASVLRGLQS